MKVVFLNLLFKTLKNSIYETYINLENSLEA